MPVTFIQYSDHLAAQIDTVSQHLTDSGVAHHCSRLHTPDEWGPALLLVTEHDLENGVLQAADSRTSVLAVLDEWDPQRAAHWLERGCSAVVPGEPLSLLVAQIKVVINHRQGPGEHEQSAEHGNLLHVVLDAVPVPIFYKDEHHIYRGCNLAFCDYIGLPREKVVGSSVYDVAPKELADIYYAADEKLLASRSSQRYEAQVRFADGSYRDIEFNKAVFFKANGDPGGQVGAMLDVTERNKLTDKLLAYSSTDPLTGAGNRRQFDDVSARQLKEHSRNGHPLSVLVIDVDHFKQINDNHGHQVGDRVLIHLVQNCDRMLREEDRLFRVGGEEFNVILPNTSLEEARRVGERLRAGIDRMPLVVDDTDLPFSISLGVAQIAADETLEQCLERADKALYRAKNEGRNRVCY